MSISIYILLIIFINYIHVFLLIRLSYTVTFVCLYIFTITYTLKFFSLYLITLFYFSILSNLLLHVIINLYINKVSAD